MRAIERIARAPDVQRVAVMPDVHLACEVCVGTVVATEKLIYPAAVGGDIGCGIATIAFNESPALDNDRIANRMLERLRDAIPIHRHHRACCPDSLANKPLSNAKLTALARHDGRIQFATLGRGNHFLEFLTDDEGRLWLMVHSGSRAMGQAIRAFHEAFASRALAKLTFLHASASEGQAYLADAEWARWYARASRRQMLDAAAEVAGHVLGATIDEATYFDCDHNHVRRETHGGQELWVHRKGAISVVADEPGIIPGSMGTESFHVAGRGNVAALCSASHGAGRKLSRDEARKRIDGAQLLREMTGVHFDSQGLGSLREEAPGAYKDVRSVLRAQGELARIVRRLRPILSYKGS